MSDPSGRAREEDESIAWTWKMFIDNPSDPFILLRMPMTKAAVRAMDATEEFTKQKGIADLKKFMIGGLSKVKYWNYSIKFIVIFFHEKFHFEIWF